MSSVERRYPIDEMTRRGDAIYERDIRPRLALDSTGQFVAIDVDSMDYEVDPNEIDACHRLRARHPEAQMVLKKVGSPVVRRFGFRATTENP